MTNPDPSTEDDHQTTPGTDPVKERMRRELTPPRREWPEDERMCIGMAADMVHLRPDHGEAYHRTFDAVLTSVLATHRYGLAPETFGVYAVALGNAANDVAETADHALADEREYPETLAARARLVTDMSEIDPESDGGLVEVPDDADLVTDGGEHRDVALRIVGVTCPECGDRRYYEVPEEGQRRDVDCENCDARISFEVTEPEDVATDGGRSLEERRVDALEEIAAQQRYQSAALCELIATVEHVGLASLGVEEPRSESRSYTALQTALNDHDFTREDVHTDGEAPTFGRDFR
jgi:hypothetical protein